MSRNFSLKLNFGLRIYSAVWAHYILGWLTLNVYFLFPLRYCRKLFFTFVVAILWTHLLIDPVFLDLTYLFLVAAYIVQPILSSCHCCLTISVYTHLVNSFSSRLNMCHKCINRLIYNNDTIYQGNSGDNPQIIHSKSRDNPGKIQELTRDNPGMI